MIGLSISTYEFDKKKPILTLTHVFWGKNLEEAYGVAKSHLKSDKFFKASFAGRFDWKGNTIRLVNKHNGQVAGLQRVTETANVQRILKRLRSAVARSGGGNNALEGDYQGHVYHVIE